MIFYKLVKLKIITKKFKHLITNDLLKASQSKNNYKNIFLILISIICMVVYTHLICHTIVVNGFLRNIVKNWKIIISYKVFKLRMAVKQKHGTNTTTFEIKHK